MNLLLAAIVGVALGGLPGLLLRRRAGELASAALTVAACLAGLRAAGGALLAGRTTLAEHPWQLPGAVLGLRLDPLAAAFLLPIFLLAGCASVYALEYWPLRAHDSAPRVRAMVGLLVAAMASVVVADSGIAFLVAWELMAVAAFFLIATEDELAEVRAAAWTYLIATHIGTLALVAMFVLLRGARGSFAFGVVAGPVAPLGIGTAILLLALVGFGFKAGLVPLHFWLPGAHANAPSHVSALLSGAMLNVGIYGLVRVLSFFPAPPAWWGALLVVVGLASAIVGITLALAQADLKRTLAYSSIENMGIVVAALGVALLGRAANDPAQEALGFAAATLHVWNHSLFKGLLFFGAGSLVHATGTRRIDSLGGLLRTMPTTSTLLLAGGASAAALPGAGAFVSELLLYLAFFRSSLDGSIVALGGALLAFTGALALAGFVRLTGVALLGSPRSEATARAHDPGLAMTGPMILLAAATLLAGLAPAAIVGLLTPLAGSPLAAGLVAPFGPALVALAAASALAAVAVVAVSRRRAGGPLRPPTWDCGYAAPSPRMQYTARSLGEWMSERLVPAFLKPRTLLLSPPRALYPKGSSFQVTVDEPFDDRLFRPAARRLGHRAMRLRWIQQGRLPLYLLYILVTLVTAIGWSIAAPLLERFR